MIFKNRREAGKKLAQGLIAYKDNPNAIIYALPRGGVVLGYEISEKLNLPLSLVIVQKEIQGEHEFYLDNYKPLSAQDKIAIIVDDGIATGFTMSLAIAEIKRQHPARIIVAVPIAPKDIAEKIRNEVDELVIIDAPLLYLGTVGAYYKNYPQIENKEIAKIISMKKQLTIGI